jgi:hypothetical protein
MSAESAVESGLSSTFFPHGLGHGIGLQVHDVAGFQESENGGTIAKPKGHPYLRLTRKLAPGMVTTIGFGSAASGLICTPPQAASVAVAVTTAVSLTRAFARMAASSNLVHWRKVAFGAFLETLRARRRQKAWFLPPAATHSRSAGDADERAVVLLAHQPH